MSELTFEQMLEESFKTIRNGEVVDGTVIDVKPDEIILNIGYKADGIITRNEYTNVLQNIIKKLIQRQRVSTTGQYSVMCVLADNTIHTEFVTRKKTCQKCRIQQNGFSKFLRPFKNRHRSLLGARWMCLVTSWMNWMKIIKLYCQSRKD